MSNQNILHKDIESSFNLFAQRPEIPEYITENLSHKLRPYQEEALQHFIFTQISPYANISYNHLLFHMATGAGKTMVMAAAILYLYQEKDYCNFLFFVNSDAIVKKTRENLANPHAPKYLFNKKGIKIDGRLISIQLVDVFPPIPAKDTIYIKLTSTQGLHTDLKEPKENSMTYDSLRETKLVLLADEAHHINVETKQSMKKLTKAEIEKHNWERTVNNLLHLNPENRLLGFTATINLENNALFEKYYNKIVYQYDLTRFMEHGYSKNVTLLPANEDDQMKMLHAVLLSQYRKYVAKDNGIDLKPIILFKSNKIDISKKAHNSFLSMIENLTVPQLDNLIQKGLTIYQDQSSIWGKMLNYYKNMNLARVISDLQWEFTKATTYNTNKSELFSEKNAVLLNTLEESDNPIRAIFSVDKLNEGWDVLNLFDIVRISESASTNKSTTDSEAQLIGRGARYYPFIYDGSFSYTRRFDEKPTEMKVIETLHYHTINDNTYIKNLENSLDAAKIQFKEDKYSYLEANMKPKFKKTELFKNGKIYINQVVPTSKEDYQSFKDYSVQSVYETNYEIARERQYGAKKEEITATQTHIVTFIPHKALYQKAIQRNRFYRFDNLSKYAPSLTSVKEFIENNQFLGGISFRVTLPLEMKADDLTPMEQLHIVEKFLKYAEEKIRLNYMKNRGTTIFEGIAFTELIDEHYAVEVSKISKGSTVSQVIKSKSMKKNDWYIYDEAIVNGLEEQLVDLIGNLMEELQVIYKEVYLIRNERKVKIVEFGGTRGFMPDFLLYLKDTEFTYQVFIEPKGKKLLEEDRWKEEFLMTISESEDIEILGENEFVKLHGIKFYSDDSQQKEAFNKDFAIKVLKKEVKEVTQEVMEIE